MSREAGHPPRHTASTRSRSPDVGAATRPVPAENRSLRGTAPEDRPVSNSDIGRRRTRVMRPVPVWRVMSSVGDAEPVRMNRPGLRPSSPAARTWFQISGANCHSSSNLGSGPARISTGSTCAASRALGLDPNITSLRACARPVDVLPQARGPSSTTAGDARSAVCSWASTTRGMYQSPIRPVSSTAMNANVPDIGLVVYQLAHHQMDHIVRSRMYQMSTS